MLKLVVGKKQEFLHRAQFAEFVASHARVLVDIGTGNGRFVLRAARQSKDQLCIGVDPVHESMRDSASRARHKRERGGAENALFVLAAAETLPDELLEIADEVTINYPWGSLLRIVVEPDERVLARVARVAKIGARLTILLNYSVFQDEDYLRRQEMPSFRSSDVDRLRDPYRRVGIEIEETGIVPPDRIPHRTWWGQKLTAGSRRQTFLLTGIRRS